MSAPLASAEAPAAGVRWQPIWRRSRLACGLRLAVAPTALPVVRLRLVFAAGADREPRGLEGLASLATPLLRAGSARRDAAGLTAAAERLGADLVSAFDWETGSLTLDALVEDLDEALDLLLDAALDPAFPAAACAQLARKRRRQLRQNRRHSPTLASDALAGMIYGDDRYGSPLIGTDRGLAVVGPSDLAKFHRARFDLGSATLVAVGGIDGETLARRLDALLGRSPARHRGPPAAAPPIGAAVARDRREIRLYDVPGAAQVDLQIGHCGVPQGAPDLVGLQLLNVVLAGGPLGRLTRTLRQRGIAYFVHSRFVARRGPGPFFIATAVRPDQAPRAVAAALDELERLLTDPIPAAELATAKRWLEGAMYRSFEAPGDVADRLTHLEAFDLPDDHYPAALAQVSELDAATLLAIARRRLYPERLAIVAAGPARSLACSLAAFGTLVEEGSTDLDRTARKASAETSSGTAGGDPPSFSIPRERR